MTSHWNQFEKCKRITGKIKKNIKGTSQRKGIYINSMVGWMTFLRFLHWLPDRRRPPTRVRSSSSYSSSATYNPGVSQEGGWLAVKTGTQGKAAQTKEGRRFFLPCTALSSGDLNKRGICLDRWTARQKHKRRFAKSSGAQFDKLNCIQRAF